MSKYLLAMLTLVGCDQSASTTAKPDPWASTPAAPAPSAKDPWSASTPAASTAHAPSAQPAAAETSPLDGTWTCAYLSTTWQNGTLITQPMTMNGFTIRGRTYTSRDQAGTIFYDGSYVTFHGAGYDEWKAAMNAHEDRSPYLVFSGEDHRSAKPGYGARSGDVKCVLRP